MIVLDTVRADHLSCYGHPRETTPFLDRIAEEGVLYEQAITPAIWTLPSHVSLFTGLFPSKHGAHRAHQKFDAPYPTLSELVTNYGYRSAAFSKVDWVNEAAGTVRGFGEFYGIDFWEWRQKEGEERDPVRDKGGRLIVDTAKEWIKKREDGTPFFLFVNLFEAHNPYDPPEPYRSLYLSGADADRIPKINRDITKYYVNRPSMDDRDFAILGNLYDGEIRYLDALLEDLIGFLRREGILDESVLIVTADHGENIGDHGHWGHRYCLYDTLVRVPLIIRYPGVFEGGMRVAPYVQTVDIYPTLMDLLGLEEPDIRKELQGEVLFPEALASRKRGFAISEFVPKPDLRAYPGYPDFDASIFAHGLTAIRHEGYKLIRSTNGRHELYHLAWDPAERGNLYREDFPKVKELRALLEDWEQSSGAFRQAPGYSVHGDSAIDDDVKARLKALGYVE